MRSIARWLLPTVALLMVACGGERRHAEAHDIEGSVWDYTEEFVYSNDDSLAKRDISIVVRYDMEYVADSVALSILTISPDSLLYEEPFTLHIPHLADMYPEEHSFVYRRNVTLQRKGDYRFRLTPEARVEGIKAVGLVVSDNK
ncbi:MAG: hypothetical protein IKB15_03465 [Alistipes sp.]|nr:hypothetical protein [Alistipes sp.]